MALSLSAICSKGQQLCRHCGQAHSLRLSLRPSYNLVPRRNNWKQNYAKREAKKQMIQEYVGENATKTSLIYAWGVASSGALGIASYLRPDVKFKNHHLYLAKINRPARVRFFDIHRLKPLDIACGSGYTVVAVKQGNKRFLVGTGVNTDSQIGYHESPKGSGRVLDQLIEPGRIRLPLKQPDNCQVTTMACGRAHTVVVVEDEGVFSLGNNAYGQCGRSIVEGEQFSKSHMINKLQNVPEDIVKVVCGQDHTLFLTSSGQVYSCGLGADGQTGVGHYNVTSQPELVRGDIAGEKIVSLGSRGDCSLAVSESGDLFGWGNSEYSQLGLITDETQVNLPRHLPVKNCGKIIKAVAGGSMCALLNDQGQVFVWGFGILGKGPKLEMTASPSHIPDPIFGRSELSPDTRVVDIECGLTYLAAKNDQGNVYTWGRNSRGCLGLNEDKDQYFPWRVNLPAEAVKICCGLDHMVTLCKSFT